MTETRVTAASQRVNNVVLVHGGFVDGSGWQAVYNALKQDGYSVTIVQNPTLSLADDVAVTRRAIAAQDGPVILVGHSYGGVVVSEAGTDEKVKAVVYIAAFAPDRAESVATLIANPACGRGRCAHRMQRLALGAGETFSAPTPGWAVFSTKAQLKARGDGLQVERFDALSFDEADEIFIEGGTAAFLWVSIASEPGR